MKTDIEIAQAHPPLAINEIAEKLAIPAPALIPYGQNKAKLRPDKIPQNKHGQIILVTSINPTPFGEGKSTTAIGLVDGLAHLGKSVIGALREPSMGPVFGLKGGAAGGGYAQVNPMEDINLHFTGDLHAITAAHNLISAVIDNHLYFGNKLRLDINKISWPRALDMNDRALRNVTLISTRPAASRASSFVITVASEIMAILCLATSLTDFKQRVAKIVIGYNLDNQPVTVADLKIVGAVTTIMKDALLPNLVQTLEHNPMLIHGGPFANIAHGNNSIIATSLATRLADYVVTEAGFGADLGAEKFFNIKCRFGKLAPSAVVIVVTVKALKLHGGVDAASINEFDPAAVKQGLANLDQHLATIRSFNSPVVVALNLFASDQTAEIAVIKDYCASQAVPFALCEAWGKGGIGARELAEQVLTVIEKPITIKHTYDLSANLETKLTQVVKNIYGGKNVVFTPSAQAQLALIKQNHGDELAVCIAKTPLSLTDDAKIKGRPTDFTITITGLRVSAGAGFVVALAGDVMTMPGLPRHPSAEQIDINENFEITGLF